MQHDNSNNQHDRELLSKLNGSATMFKKLLAGSGNTIKSLYEQLDKRYGIADKLSYDSFTRWTRGEIVPNLSIVALVSDYYGIYIDQLVYGENFKVREDVLPSEREAQYRKTISTQEETIINLQDYIKILKSQIS